MATGKMAVVVTLFALICFVGWTECVPSARYPGYPLNYPPPPEGAIARGAGGPWAPQNGYQPQQVVVPIQQVQQEPRLVLVCRVSEALTQNQQQTSDEEHPDWFVKGDGSVPPSERMVLMQEGKQVELNLTLGASSTGGEYSCSGLLPPSGEDDSAMSIRSVRNVTVFEKAREMSDDEVLDQQPMDINPLSLRRGEWYVTWNYDNRPEIISIVISYMKKANYHRDLKIKVSVTFYRDDVAFQKKIYRIKDIFIDTDYGIQLLAMDKSGEVRHQMSVQRSNSRYQFGSEGSNSDGGVIRQSSQPQDGTTEKPSRFPKTTNNYKFLIIIGAVIFVIIDMLCGATKKCGLFHFIWMTTCGPPLGDQKELEEDEEEEEDGEEKKEKVEEEEEEKELPYGAELKDKVKSEEEEKQQKVVEINE